MALDLPLPRQVMVHGHWTINHEKMSKSTGNVVNPFFAIDRFGVDTMRFYLARIGNTVEDSNYDNAYIIECYKKMLQWGLGNLAGRTIGCAKGNLRSLIVKAASNELPSGNARDEEFQAFLAQMPTEVAGHMKDLNTHAAAKSITTIVEQVSLNPCKQLQLTCRRKNISMNGSRGRSRPSLNGYSTTSARRYGSPAFSCSRSCRGSPSSCWTRSRSIATQRRGGSRPQDPGQTQTTEKASRRIFSFLLSLSKSNRMDFRFDKKNPGTNHG